jgi:D-3-phosphoglycerate dehydrogenase / 2-oxoglutarate reductase
VWGRVRYDRLHMARFSVLYTDRADYSRDLSVEQPIYAAIDAEIVDARLDHNALDWDTYERLLRVADAVVCFRVPVSRRAVAAAPRLKIAVRSGVGYDNLDLAALAERGIAACNVPDYGSEEVAVHALSLALALRRRVLFFDRELRAGRWRGWQDPLPIHRLSKQTVGVIGLGRIGSAFAVRAGALFGEVLAHDPYVEPEAFRRAGAQACTLDELLERADVISLHVPLYGRTEHLIGARELGLMKPNAVLVNTARGAVVDQLALAAALEAGRIEGAACDVWEREPPDPGHPLFGCRNFIGSPHVAGNSVEGELDNRTKQAQEVVRVLSGQPPRSPVIAPEVLYGAGSAGAR